MFGKYFLAGLSFLIAAALNGSLWAASDSFSVNFYAYGKPDVWDTDADKATLLLDPDQSAGHGDWATTGWVNVAVPWGLDAPADPLTLTSPQGFVATLTLNDARHGGPHYWTQVRTTLLGDGNGNLMDGHAHGTEDPYDGTQIFDMTVSGIPYAAYDVIIYMGADSGNAGNGTGRIVFNGVPRDIRVKTSEFDGAFREIVDDVTPGNYVHFPGVTGSSFTTQVWGNGFNHIGPCGFQVFAPDTTGQLPKDRILRALTELKKHVEGTLQLSDSQVAAHKATLDAEKLLFGASESVMAAAFDLVHAYDRILGPLWVPGSAMDDEFDRRTVVEDIHWTVYHVMQYIMDYTYTSANLALHEPLLGRFRFGSAQNFPGQVDPPADPDAVYTATINGSFPKTYGHPTMHWADRPARKPTGAYLAPGTVATVTVPASLVNTGFQIRVGAHALDMSKRPFVRRLDRSSLAYDITSTETKVANPLGGGIYIEVPYRADAGVVDIQIKNSVRAPYYSHNTVTGHITTLTQWQNVERHHSAPWADFQSEKFMMQVPTAWIYRLERVSHP